jgi:tetratricopeptide (TPR) repeat protein
MRKVFTWIVTLAFLLPSAALADTVPQLFNAGVNEYRQGNYDRAAGIFLDLYEKYEIRSPDVLANLGSAEFAAGRPGQALTHLQKAVRMAPDSRAGQTAAVNMDRIRSLLNESQTDMSRSAHVFGSYTDPWIALFSWLEPSVALAAFLVCWALFFTALAIRRLFITRSSTIMISATLALMMISALGAYASSRIVAYRTGVIVVQSAPLMSDITSTEASATLPEGLEFRIIQVRGAWVNIRLSSGLTGWISDSDAGIP